MHEHTIHDALGNLLERTTEEIIGNVKYFKKYDGQGNLLKEWQEEIPIKPPTEQERLDALEQALLLLMMEE